MTSVYPHDERVKSRSTIKRLDALAARIENMALGRIPFEQNLVAGVTALTDTSDLASQHQALAVMSEARRKQHFDRLTEIAPDDLTAFAECISPHEPPAPHLIYISERLMEIERGDRDRLILSMPPGHAKDLDVDTPVMMGDGSWKRLGDIQAGDMVITHKGRPREVLATHDQGVRPVVEITTDSRRVVRAHEDHVFLTPGGWLPAKDLRNHMALAIPKEYEITGSTARPIDEFSFMGYLFAGSVVTGRSYSRFQTITNRFRCDDPIILENIKSVAKRLGFTWVQQREIVYSESVMTLQFDDEVKEWLKARDVWRMSKLEARVPKWVFGASQERISAFLSSVLSCDATFRPKADHRGENLYKKVSLSIRENLGLTWDMIRLFQVMGIKASLNFRHAPYNQQPTTFFRVDIVDHGDLLLLSRRIPLIGSTRRFWDLPLVSKTFSNPDFHTDEIRSIKPAGECQTRCLTVEEDASFLANGIVVHNSTYGSRYYPSWYLGRKENRLYLQAGHTADFAVKEFGRKTKDIIMSDAYRRIFPGVQLRFDAKASGDWALTNGNRYVAKGVGDNISGFRSSNNGIDDPYANFAAAQSPVTRKKVWEWFVNDFMTRLLPQGNAFVITCMTGDTPVSMADGTYKQIRDIKIGDMVWAQKDGKPVKRMVTNFKEQGEDAVFEIRTGNSKVRANARHPFQVMKDGVPAWVRVSDLSKGDYLTTSAKLPDGGGSTLTDEEAWLLGFMFGDGWITKRDTTQGKKGSDKRFARRGYVTCAAIKVNEDTNTKVMAAFKSIFDTEPKKTRFGYIRTEIADIGRWFIERGLLGTAKTKRLPAYLYSESHNIKMAFLAGFAVADGHLAGTGKDGLQPRMVMVSCNEELMTDIRHLARGCGFNVTNLNISHCIAQAPNSPKPTESTRVTFAYSLNSRSNDAFRTNFIRSIEPVGHEIVYDIEVEDAECFIADGLLTHNTRWHMDDIVGRLLEMMESGEIDLPWDFINLPVFCTDEASDQMGRRLDEPLWPDFYTTATLLRQKALMSPPQWCALYEGNPVPMEGNVIKAKWLLLRYKTPPLLRANSLAASLSQIEKEGQEDHVEKNDARDPIESQNSENDSGGKNDDTLAIAAVLTAPSIIGRAPAFTRTVMSVDSAEKDTQRADYSALTIWREGIDRRHYLVDAHRERMEFPRLCACIDEYAALWDVELVLMETKGAGNQYIQHTQALETPKPFVVVPCEPGKDGKIFRMDAQTPFFMANRVILPERAPWLATFERELLQFPGSKNDDFADTVSQYLKFIRDHQHARRGTKKLRM